MLVDAYRRRAATSLQRARALARWEPERLAAQVRELGGKASVKDVDEWECQGEYPAWVLMLLYEQAGLSPEHVTELLNDPTALFRRAYGLINGEAHAI